MTLEQLTDEVGAYNPDADLEMIGEAYHYAYDVHRGQLRASGEPYIEHPVQVAHIVASLKLDEACVAAALLHDTVEDTAATVDDIRERFGEPIANLVDGLTALSSVHFQSKRQSQAENFRKMLVAMAKDIRVILVKLADRVHNMRTLQYLSEEAQIKIARETIDIYAPLANRIGIAWIKTELEDLSFRYLFPEEYQSLRTLVNKKRHQREHYATEMVEKIADVLRPRGFGDKQISGRAKHFYSIYKKMKRQGIEFDQVYDLLAFRILVDTIPQCYEVLGIIHTEWKPIPGRFKDYIALPKANGYQSLHTAVIGPYGEKLEVQIRTREMHRVAEHGIAAHWKYKEGAHAALTAKDEQDFAWLKQLVEWQQELRDPAEFLDSLKVDLFPDEVYTFTPNGDLKVLSKGATPLDFAYSVHSEVGHRCVGAKVNGRMVPLSTELKNGDRVEILTNPNSKPNRDWLKFVTSSRAKHKIRTYIRLEQRTMSRELGRGMLEKEFRRLGKGYDKLIKTGDVGRAAKEFKCQTVDELCILVGSWKVSPEQVSEIVLPEPERKKPEPKGEARSLGGIVQSIVGRRKLSKAKSPVRIAGVDDMLVRFAQCCKPVPGEDVVGFVTRGRGVTVHLRSCPFVQSQPPERMLDVEWERRGEEQYDVQVRVSTVDRKGILTNLTDAIAARGVNISSAICRSGDDGRAVNTFSLSVKDKAQLASVLRALERQRGVFSVERIRS